MVHIISHTDLDGYSASYIVSHHFGENEVKSIQHLNYDKSPDMEKFKRDDIVVITDYSLSDDEYRLILDIVGKNNIIWLDHHISAIERYNNSGLFLRGLRSNRFCGATLSYLYFEKKITSQSILDDLSDDAVINMLPKWLVYVDSWDCWKKTDGYYQTARMLNIAIANDLSENLIDYIASDPLHLDDIINRGRICLEYQDHLAQNYLDKYFYTRTLPRTGF